MMDYRSRWIAGAGIGFRPGFFMRTARPGATAGSQGKTICTPIAGALEQWA